MCSKEALLALLLCHTQCLTCCLAAAELPAQLNSSTALGSPPKAAGHGHTSFDMSLLSSHHVPGHKPSGFSYSVCSIERKGAQPNLTSCRVSQRPCLCRSSTSGSRQKLSLADHAHKPQQVRNPFQGLSITSEK